MILSPPRHGKTELLIHFAVWRICKNPNIRIMWVGGNEDIANELCVFCNRYIRIKTKNLKKIFVDQVVL